MLNPEEPKFSRCCRHRIALSGTVRLVAPRLDFDADTIEKIIQEVAAARETERGMRADDKRSETAMEDRKKEGYF